MITLSGLVARQLRIACLGRLPHPERRQISALYITGDKANENYAALQPYMDFESTLSNKEPLQYSIAQRKLEMDLSSILVKYEKFREINTSIKQLEMERELVAKKLKERIKAGASDAGSNSLKEEGKTLRNKLKSLKESFYPVQDDFVHAFLNLPNELHPNCPIKGKEKILYRSSAPCIEQGDSHLLRKDLIRYLDSSRYYMLREAAEFDVHCTHAMTRYFVHTGGFLQTANPDFVRCVLLEANATPLDDYHLVVEEHLQNKINSAYLTGGAAFESFLGAVTKLTVYPSVLPLRFVSCGRNYEKTKNQPEGNLFTATQTNAVQSFCATTSAIEADQQMDEILNLMVNFYKALGVHFRIVYADASELTPAECLRAVIEIYSPAQRRYICVGRVSNYTDFVSKRILFTTRQQKDYHFLNLVGGTVLYTTRLIAALIENNIPLDQCKLLGAYEASKTQKAIDEFKNVFK